MTSDRDTFEPLSAPVERVIAEMERDIARLAAERAATDATANELARREAEIRERAGERKDAAE